MIHNIPVLEPPEVHNIPVEIVPPKRREKMATPTMTTADIWQKCKARATEGRDVNSGGLGRLKVAGNTYVGGFFLNLILLYSPETGGIIKANSHSPSYPCPDVSLTPEEYCLYLTR